MITWAFDDAEAVSIGVADHPARANRATPVSSGPPRGRIVVANSDHPRLYAVARTTSRDGRERQFIVGRRSFDIDGWINARDVGGYSTPRGPIRWGRLFRSAAPTDAQPAMIAAMRDLGIERGIDLRTTQEQKSAPVDLPFEVVHVPLTDHFMDPEKLKQLTISPDALAWRIFTSAFFESEPGRAQRVFELLAEQRPTLVFCGGGKDRTGIVIALALAAIGVEFANILSDFALSAEAARDLEARIQPIGKALAARGVDPRYFPASWNCDPSLLERAFARLESDHGSARSLLEHGLGVRPAAIDALADWLTAPEDR